MKLAFLFVAFLSLAACGTKDGLDLSSTPQLCDGSPCASNPALAKFKTSGGEDYISLGDISEVTINLYKTSMPPAADAISRTFTGRAAANIVKQLGLNAPRNLGGVLDDIATGDVTVTYRQTGSAVRTKTFTIGNSETLDDQQFPDVFYYTAQKLTHDWLAAQPEN